MGQKHLFRNGKTIVWRIGIAALATMILAGCGSTLLGGGKAESTTVIWHHRDQYVRIEPQDRGTGQPVPNDHPAQLSPEEIHNMLGALEIEVKSKKDVVPLFTKKELDILDPALSQGLAQAGPGQDVTFAVVGIHRGIFSFTTDRAVVTGRVFVTDGKLNLILGQMHEEYNEDEDRRMHPFLPGSREYTPVPNWKKNWEPVPMAGLQTATDNGIVRHDWLVLKTDPQIWKAAIETKKEAKETAKSALKQAAQAHEENAQVSAEQERMRNELEALKRDMQSIKQAPAATAPEAQPAVQDNIESRLRRLQSLHDKGLITDEEYKAKRQEILESL